MRGEVITTRLDKLPDNLKREVLDFAEFLLQKYSSKEVEKKEFSFDWEGGLSKLQGSFTSVELQHKSMEWR